MPARYRQGYRSHRQHGGTDRRKQGEVRRFARCSGKDRCQDSDHQSTHLPDRQCKHRELRNSGQLAPALGLLRYRDKQANHGCNRDDGMVAMQSGPPGARVARQGLQAGCQYPGIDACGEQQERALQAQGDTAGMAAHYRHRDRKQRPKYGGSIVRQYQAAPREHEQEAERRIEEEVAATGPARFRGERERVGAAADHDAEDAHQPQSELADLCRDDGGR